jgi:chromosomal replication initiation ATPase DnaA
MRNELFDIAFECARRVGITTDDMRSKRKTRAIADARAEYAWRGHNAGFSFPQLGRFLHKDHSAMVLAFQRWDRKMALAGLEVTPCPSA